MEYLVVFSIYLMVITEWAKGALELKNFSVRSYMYCRTAGLFNFIFGMIGLVLFNLFIRDKGIIQPWAFWAGFSGFIILMLTGLYYIFRMITSKMH